MSDRGLTRRAYLNTLSEGLDYGARLLVGFIVNPLLLQGLGVYLFGLWQILDRLSGHLTTAGNRPFQALKLTLAQQNTFDDYDAKRREVGSALVAWVLIALPLTLAVGALAWFAPGWLGVPAEHDFAVRAAALLLAANLLLISLVDLPRSALIGENLGYKRMGWSALLVLVGGALTAFALWLGAGIFGVAAAVVLLAAANGVLFLWLCRRYIVWFGAARPGAEPLRRFLKLSGWFFSWALLMTALRAGDVVVLGALDSVAVVSDYALTRYVPEAVISIIMMIEFGVTPGIGGIVGAGDLRRAAALRAEVMALSWLLLAAAGVSILLWNPSFVALWVGPEHYAGDLECLLIVVLVIQFVLIQNDGFLIDVTLKMRAKVLLGVAAALLSIGAAALLVGRFGLGISGLCLGLIAGRALLSFGYPWLIGIYLGVRFKDQLRAALRPFLALTLMLALAFQLQPLCSADNWARLILAVAVTAPAAALLAFVVGLSAAQRRRLMTRVNVVIRA